MIGYILQINNREYFKKIYFYIVFTILSTTIQAQVYYGKNQFGRLKFINDTTGTVTFISLLSGGVAVDTCDILKHEDTIWLSTKAKWRYKVNVFDEPQTSSNPWYPVIIKRYYYASYDKKYKYHYEGEGVAMYDSVTNSIIYENKLWGINDYIIAFKDIFEYFRVKCSFGNSRNDFAITIEYNPDYHNGVVFDNFPLLIKNNRLKPIDKNEQMKCWLDNGFFFPKMKKSKKSKRYNIRNGLYIGLMNLPSELGTTKPIPIKYRKFL